MGKKKQQQKEERAEVQAANERESLRSDRLREQEVDDWGVVVDTGEDAKQKGFVGRASEDEA